MKRLLRRAALAALALVCAGTAALAFAAFAIDYPRERLLPSTGATITVLDRGGRLLREIPAGEDGGRQRWVRLDEIDAAVLLATIGSEDHRFFQHRGVDPVGVARAALLDLRAGRAAYGGSTLSMQLVRLIEPRPRTLWSKLVEAVVAVRLERAIGKQEILEQYLNRAFYGNGCVGIEAAATRYFGKHAGALSVGEGTLLAILPRAPSFYDPARHLDRALARRAHVLDLLVARGLLDPERRRVAEAQPIAIDREPPAREAPHFVDWALQTLSPARRAELQAHGGVVRTTLDLPLQRLVEERVRERLAEREGGVQAGLVILDPATGAVRAMVGSADYDDAASGQLNIMTTPRHPGSALKPFAYAMAIEQGDSPATIVDDSDGIEGYRPHGAAHRHGPARYREALAGSYNLAAVHVLERVGVARFLERLREAGLGPLPGAATDYGLALVRGAGRVRLVDLAAAYGFLVNEGRVVRARAVEEVGGVAVEREPARALFQPAASWLVMDMLSDNGARRAVFGAELPLDLPFRVAAKTGTSSGFADTVTVAATREAIVAAWAGRFDGGGTRGTLAMWSAAPIARAGLLAVASMRGAPLTLPPRPAGIEERVVCRDTGLLAGPDCPTKRERFASGTAPAPGEVCRQHSHYTRRP